MTDEKIIELILERKEHKALVKLYRYQGKVEALIQSRGGTKEDARDIFQEALVIFCKKVWEGNFQLTSKLDTFLYSICYNLWRNVKKAPETEISDNFQAVSIDGLDELLEKEQKIKKVEFVLQKLGEPCFRLLRMFYYEALKMKEIAKKLGYSSEKTAKAQKYKCIERAKKMI